MRLHPLHAEAEVYPLVVGATAFVVTLALKLGLAALTGYVLV